MVIDDCTQMCIGKVVGHSGWKQGDYHPKSIIVEYSIFGKTFRLVEKLTFRRSNAMYFVSSNPIVTNMESISIGSAVRIMLNPVSPNEAYLLDNRV